VVLPRPVDAHVEGPMLTEVTSVVRAPTVRDELARTPCSSSLPSELPGLCRGCTLLQEGAWPP
jgi:hypothetical protein